MRSSEILAALKPNVLDAFGRDWFEVEEGVDGKLALVGRVTIDQWATAK